MSYRARGVVPTCSITSSPDAWFATTDDVEPMNRTYRDAPLTGCHGIVSTGGIATKLMFKT